MGSEDILGQRGDFDIISHEEVYKNPWMVVTEDKVYNRISKTIGVFGSIYTKDAVSILAVDGEGNVYLVKEFKYALNKKQISVPGGFIDEGETALFAAKRELKEETGITANEWLDLGEMSFFGSVQTSKYYLFLAKGLTFGADEQELTESIEVIKLSFKEAYRKVIENEMSSAPAIALVLRAKEILEGL